MDTHCFRTLRYDNNQQEEFITYLPNIEVRQPVKVKTSLALPNRMIWKLQNQPPIMLLEVGGQAVFEITPRDHLEATILSVALVTPTPFFSNDFESSRFVSATKGEIVSVTETQHPISTVSLKKLNHFYTLLSKDNSDSAFSCLRFLIEEVYQECVEEFRYIAWAGIEPVLELS